VFCGRKDGNDRFDIYSTNLATREWKNMTEKYVFQVDDTFGHSIGCDDDMIPYRATGMAWSPRGDLLIVNAGGPYIITPYIMRVSEEGDVIKIVQQWPRPWPDLHIFESPQDYSWSPDGTKVAFVGMTASDGYNNLFVGEVSNWVMSNSNTPVIQLTKEYRDWPGVIYYPVWSPNAESVAVSLNRHSSGISILSADSAQAVYVTEDTSEQLSRVKNPTSPWVYSKPSWFPDSEAVVFVAATTPNDRTALFRVDKDGQNLMLLIPTDVINPVVSPDGQYIAYIEYGEIYELDTIGQIVRVDADGKNRQVLTKVEVAEGVNVLGKYYIRDLSWSPDGKSLIFTTNKSGNFQLYLVMADGSVTEQVMEFPGDAVNPQWRPNNKP
jgi:Tol biopolymer transport system component